MQPGATSFGNVAREPLDTILERMGRCFCRPRTVCVGRILAGRIPSTGLPLGPEESLAVCEQHLPQAHALPRFFRIRDAAGDADVGAAELRKAYDRVRDDYDEFWVTAAGAPVERLIADLALRGGERVFEAGCGTGFATAQLARHAGDVLAVDLSEGMLTRARKRLEESGVRNGFRPGTLDALAPRRAVRPDLFGLILVYIPWRHFSRQRIGPGVWRAPWRSCAQGRSPRKPLGSLANSWLRIRPSFSSGLRSISRARTTFEHRVGGGLGVQTVSERGCLSVCDGAAGA